MTSKKNVSKIYFASKFFPIKWKTNPMRWGEGYKGSKTKISHVSSKTKHVWWVKKKKKNVEPSGKSNSDENFLSILEGPKQRNTCLVIQIFNGLIMSSVLWGQKLSCPCINWASKSFSNHPFNNLRNFTACQALKHLLNPMQIVIIFKV